MDKSITNSPEKIEVPVWWTPGTGVSYRRDSLSVDHPEHTYNYMKYQMGVEPEKYGILHPYTEKYKDYTREQLMSKLAELENDLKNAYNYL